MSRYRGGFTLIELLVAIAILIAIATVVVPTIAGSLDETRVDAAEESLRALASAVSDFADDVREHPATLSQLTQPITGTDPDVCGETYNAGEQGRWSGPYLDRVIPATGIPVGIGTVADNLVIQARAGGTDLLGIRVSEVTPDDAASLDARVDNGDGAGGGTIRWTAPGVDGLVTLDWFLPMLDC